MFSFLIFCKRDSNLECLFLDDFKNLSFEIKPLDQLRFLRIMNTVLKGVSFEDPTCSFKFKILDEKKV